MRSTYAVGAAVLTLALAVGCSSAADRDAGDAAPASVSPTGASDSATPEASAPDPGRPQPRPAPTTIPEGFLIYDPLATSDPKHWQRDNQAFPPAYCPAGGKADVPRELAGRTLQYQTPAGEKDDGRPEIDSESLRVYATEAEAERMLDAVRAEVRLCAGARDDEGNEINVSQESLDIGDEAVTVVIHHGGDSSDVEIWVRRGTAVAAYGRSAVPVNGDAPQAERDARTMAEKLCHYDGGC